MGMTLAEKILAAKSGKSCVHPGEIVVVPVDCAMMTDILGPRILAHEMERLDARIKKPDSVVIVADHYTPAATEHQAEIVKFSREWAKKYGVENYYELEGPCHQLLAEKCFSLPGTILVGTDSHSCSSGAFACFGTGIGSTEMLGVLITGEIWFKVPQSMKVVWTGLLRDGVMAKDMILHTIGAVGHAGATYMSMEFSGEAITALPMDERICISNMAVEAGAKVGLIASDAVTLEYLRAHGAQDLSSSDIWRADDDALYSAQYCFNASELGPTVACPHEVDNTCAAQDIAGQHVDQVYIGSCTGGRLSDLHMAARILRGRKVAHGCRLLVSPASRNIWAEALRDGTLQTLAEAGAIVLASSCGACLGLHSGTIGAGEICVSTTNRNFIGRQGSRDGNTYLSSAATAAAAALHGEIRDPREYLQEEV